jgi:cytoskeletal protein CcmA (bactofilin family)
VIRTSRIPPGVIVEGQIRGQGDLVIAGLVEGSLDVDGLVVIEATGQVRGPIRAKAISVSGSVQGPLTADDSIRLEPGARVVGDVVAANVSAGLGAMVRGRVRMAGAERLDRTEGGTVRAPWSSAGSLVAARTATGMIAAPKMERLPQTIEAPPPPAEEKPQPKRVRTASLGAAQPPAPAPVPAPVAAPATPVRRAPPPPVMPSLGRVRARRKDGGERDAP